MKIHWLADFDLFGLFLHSQILRFSTKTYAHKDTLGHFHFHDYCLEHKMLKNSFIFYDTFIFAFTAWEHETCKNKSEM